MLERPSRVVPQSPRPPEPCTIVANIQHEAMYASPARSRKAGSPSRAFPASHTMCSVPARKAEDAGSSTRRRSKRTRASASTRGNPQSSSATPARVSKKPCQSSVATMNRPGMSRPMAHHSLALLTSKILDLPFDQNPMRRRTPGLALASTCSSSAMLCGSSRPSSAAFRWTSAMSAGVKLSSRSTSSGATKPNARR